jgi:hypothetical protein
MILSDIRHYLEQRGQATLADIALHFDADPDAIRPDCYRDLYMAKCGGRHSRAVTQRLRTQPLNEWCRTMQH